MKLLKRIISIGCILFGSHLYAVGPRAWSKVGTATTTNSQSIVGNALPFYPASLCVKNTGATNALFINWDSGVATAVIDSTQNVQIDAGDEKCFNYGNPNVMNVMTVGSITSAATTTYRFIAMAAR